jgi:hypothetical protein
VTQLVVIVQILVAHCDPESAAPDRAGAWGALA